MTEDGLRMATVGNLGISLVRINQSKLLSTAVIGGIINGQSNPTFNDFGAGLLV